MDAVLKRLQEICLAWPETSETTTFGHPTFRAGKKTFAVLDHYHGEPCIAFKAEPRRVHELLEDPHFYLAPYGAAHGWMCLRVAARMSWKQVRALLLGSYRLVALRRMLVELDGARRRSRATTSSTSPRATTQRAARTK